MATTKKTKRNNLEQLLQSGYAHLLTEGFKGIEKESLRIGENGFISQLAHPKALGSALTHPNITTDYSEALLEFITPPFVDIQKTLEFLNTIHQFVYQNLGNELLLAASMPCGINGDASIPIARYGHSNIGKMKHVYRKGLDHRYGRTMQSIAGIHFNYSVPEAVWPILQGYDQQIGNISDYISSEYFAMIRNFQRIGWILLYLFGASPAICKSFFKTRPQYIANFDAFDNYTLYHPYATSLRMSDIGYKSNSQAELDINYNSLSDYVKSLMHAIDTPYPEYSAIGVKKDGEYLQLNSNILQIENEYYSTIRPKQIALSCEKPTLALKKRGVRYIEIRSLDLNLFEPLGINEASARFIEALLLSCLFQDSPPSSFTEQQCNNQNQLLVAHQGRKPGLQLQRGEQSISLKDWAHEIFNDMQKICSILDQNLPGKPYTHALLLQQQSIDNPELTPSAQILASMRQNQQPFAPYALQTSTIHKQHFARQSLHPEIYKDFVNHAQKSFDVQKEIENKDQLSFDDFLLKYFSQS